MPFMSMPPKPYALLARRYSAGVDQRDRDAGDSLAAADPAHALVGRRLDADRCREYVGEDPLDLGLVLLEPWLVADDRGIGVQHRPRQLADDGRQQVDRVGVAPAIVGVGKVGTEVAEPGGAQQCV